MIDWISILFLDRPHRNAAFKAALPVYRLALREWLWRGKKQHPFSRDFASRWETVKHVEVAILEWQVHLNFITQFFIEPPEDLIRRVLSL